MNYLLKYTSVFATSTALCLFSASGQIVDSGFGTTGSGNVNPNVQDHLDDGWNWSTGRGAVPSSGGNPDSYFDLTQPNGSNSTSLVQVFSSAGAGTVQGELLEFDFFLSDEGNSPVFTDNELRIEVFGTNSTAQFETRLEVGEVGDPAPDSPDPAGDNRVKLLDETLTTEVRSVTGWTTLNSTVVASGTDYDYYGLRITGINFLDGGGQPGQEGAGIDNVSFVAVPEPSSFALLAGLLALGLISVMRRRRG